VNLGDLAAFPAGTRVTMELLQQKGLIRRSTERIKVLALGELKVALTVVAAAVSEAAKAKIEAAGGKVEIG
jgi:large subunit ribosomal protein L15